MTEPAGKPKVTLDWSLWCPRHLKPYRAQWPKGAAVAMVRLFQAAAAMPAVTDAARGDVANLTAALQRFRPLCCFISREQLDAIYADTLPGRPDGD